MKTAKSLSSGYGFQYAVKFICTSTIPGTSQTSSFPPGSYETVVNIHNPNSRAAGFRMKIAASTSTNLDTPIISEFIKEKLKPDQATGVSCNRLQEFGLHLIHGFEGFLVIESSMSLDVVAVYTAAFKGGVVSMDVEYIRERKLRQR